MREEFKTHQLSGLGIQKSNTVGEVFDRALTELEKVCGLSGRDMAIVKTKLEEAAFFAKRAVASQPNSCLSDRPGQ